MDSNNYIGSLPQVNTPERYWPTFFLRHRLEPLVKAARDAHAMDGGTNPSFRTDLHPPRRSVPTRAADSLARRSPERQLPVQRR